MFIYSLLLFTATAAASLQAPKPRSLSEDGTTTGYKTLHGKHGPIADQLAAFNDLEYHAHTRFYAKSMNYNEVKAIGDHIGPFRVSFQCTDAKIEANITITNSFSYPVTFHGNFLSGADSTAVNLLSTGETVSLKVAEFYDASATGNRIGSTAAKGAIFLSNGYFLALSNADSFIMTVSNDDTDDRMPNSDCTVAGFMEFAHPKHGQYYDGFLYGDELLTAQQASSLLAGAAGGGVSSAQLAGGVFAGVLAGAAVVVVTTLLLTKNRSLLLHVVGCHDSSPSSLGACMEDSSCTGLTAGTPTESTSTPTA